MGYSPWGLKELDRTEQLTLSFYFLRRTRQSLHGFRELTVHWDEQLLAVTWPQQQESIRPGLGPILPSQQGCSIRC